MKFKIALMGKPGSGKTTSLFEDKSLGIKGFPKGKMVYLNVTDKLLPISAIDVLEIGKSIKDGGYYADVRNFQTLKQVLQFVNEKRKDINYIVVDDCGYLMSRQVMSDLEVKGYDKWTILAKNFYTILDDIPLRKDLFLICVFHTEVGKDGKLKIKTVGQMTDNIVIPDGLFPFIWLYEYQDDGTGKEVPMIKVTGDSYTTVRSISGIFDKEYYPNDLYELVKIIEEKYAPILKGKS